MTADDASTRVKTTAPWAVWEPVDPDRGAAAFRRLSVGHRSDYTETTYLSGRASPLPFYHSHALLELCFGRNGDTERVFVLDGPHATSWLDGSSDPIHEANDSESLELSNSNILDYVRFFFYFLRGDADAFVLIESSDEITETTDGEDSTPTDGDEPESPGLDLATARANARALSAEGIDDTGAWLVNVTVAYDGTLFNSKVAVASGGEIEMTDDEPIGSLNGLRVPEAPSLAPLRLADDAALRDRDVTKAVVSVLLDDAIRDLNEQTRPGAALLHHFNSKIHGKQPTQQLAVLIAESKAMVIIESDIPFVEDVVAELVAPGAFDSAVRAGAVNGDDLRCEITVSDRGRLFLLSFHTYRSLFDAERAAHELSLSEGAVLIGCNRADEVPEPLRRTTDLILTFPRIDKKRFVRIFEQVFQDQPADGWDGPTTDWTKYLIPGDFHTPSRLSLDADAALAMLRDRVQARLNRVTPDIGPGMDGLHGMGEARQVAEDLIEDIRAAQAGRIPWSAVDRGLLLTGAPGTGKTTLARAIAKECGVKFVAASAASWQAAGALDAHLRAMRADFATARRYAPAILFIDEIDSIGSRQQLEGPNAMYQTEVINALLEQIQGIDTTGSVIVIGATNYADKIDPALRRAGRLDQTVEIPLPNVEALEQIFKYYLSEFESASGELGSDIDERALAEMSFGLTAADVEFFVRGGARRARRALHPVSQADLMAEVTRRPRRPDSAPPLIGSDLHRVAVHEAGHAVARLTSSTRGADLAFASIIPRLDGSLGFTATAPTDTRVTTRAGMVEQLETVLGGRAAEEVVFGADDIGTGAGGPGEGSDLAVATQLATILVCQSGLGDDGMLYWTREPTDDQLDKIDTILGEAYRSIRTRLNARRALLEHVATALQQQQELSGYELRRLAESLGPSE